MSHCGTSVRWGTQQPGISRGHRRRLPTAGTENITTHCPAHPQLVTASPLRSSRMLAGMLPRQPERHCVVTHQSPSSTCEGSGAASPSSQSHSVLPGRSRTLGLLGSRRTVKNQGLWAPTKNTASSTCLSTPGYLLKSFLSSACSVGRATEAQSSYVNCPFLYR